MTGCQSPYIELAAKQTCSQLDRWWFTSEQCL